MSYLEIHPQFVRPVIFNYESLTLIYFYRDIDIFFTRDNNILIEIRSKKTIFTNTVVKVCFSLARQYDIISRVICICFSLVSQYELLIVITLLPVPVITITSTYTLNGYPIQAQDTGLIMLSVGPPSATLAQHSTIIG